MTAPFWQEGVERLLGTTIVLTALPVLNASGVSVGREKLRSYGPSWVRGDAEARILSWGVEILPSHARLQERQRSFEVADRAR